MGSTDTQTQGSSALSDLKLEVIVIPVSDVDRSKDFYLGLGWRLDADFPITDDYRAVQITPPHSACSIWFGKGVTPAAPGSAQGLMLVVDDIEAARAELIARGLDVSETFHPDKGIVRVADGKERLPGRHPEGRSYFSWASFNDPDGNTWLLQEVTARLPGRLWPNTDIATLTELLRETEQQHGEYERHAPEHHWSGWYAAYVIAREQGKSPVEAAQEASQHVENTRAQAA